MLHKTIKNIKCYLGAVAVGASLTAATSLQAMPRKAQPQIHRGNRTNRGNYNNSNYGGNYNNSNYNNNASNNRWNDPTNDMKQAVYDILNSVGALKNTSKMRDILVTINAVLENNWGTWRAEEEGGKKNLKSVYLNTKIQELNNDPNVQLKDDYDSFINKIFPSGSNVSKMRIVFVDNAEPDKTSPLGSTGAYCSIHGNIEYGDYSFEFIFYLYKNGGFSFDLYAPGMKGIQANQYSPYITPSSVKKVVREDNL